MNRQQSISYVEESILTILNRHELYGLEIITAIEQGSEGKLKLGFGTLYPTLRRLEKKGFVETRWGSEISGEREGARRKYFKISAKGAEILHQIQQIRAELMKYRCQELVGEV